MKPPGTSDERRGILILGLAAFFFSLFGLTSKAVSEEISSVQMIFVRSIIMAPLLGIWAVRRGHSLLGKRRWLLFLRGAVGTASLFAFFFALKRLPLADTVLIFQAHPLVVAALAPWLLGEKNRPIHWLLLCLSLAGVALVVGPTGEGSWEGRLSIFVCCVLAGFVYILVRFLKRTEQTLTITFWFPAIAVLVTGPAFLLDLPGFTWTEPSPRDWVFMVLLAVTAILGQVLLTLGLGRVPAARGTAVSNLQVALALVYGIVFFAEFPGIVTITGAVLIVVVQFVLAVVPPSPSTEGDDAAGGSREEAPSSTLAKRPTR